MTNASLPLPASADEHIAPAPRVSVQAFCETVETAAAVQTAGEDRRLAKAHVKLQMGESRPPSGRTAMRLRPMSSSLNLKVVTVIS